MNNKTRIVVGVGVLALLGALVVLGWQYHAGQGAAGPAAATITVNVTSAADRGPGTLREALFVVAAAKGKADVSIKVKSIVLESALPPLVNPHGVRVLAEPGAEIDAHALTAGAVFDVAGANTSLEGLTVRNCPAAAVLLRATHFRLRSSTVEACDVGVEVAENANDVLLERNHFVGDRVGVRFAASSRNAVLLGNEFSNNKDAGLWAVRAEPDPQGAAVSVRENRFKGGKSGVVAANVAVQLERNEFAGAQDAAIHLLGAGAVIRGNHISGGPAMGIIAENARETVIDDNQLEHLAAYGIMVRGSSSVLVRANRVSNSGYGLAFVLGEPKSPSSAVDNTIVEPQFNGIDVIGDSPIVRHNQVLRPRAFALHTSEYQRPDGSKVPAHPLLDGNNFRADTIEPPTGAARGLAKQP